MNEEKGTQMADIPKKKPHHLKRPVLTACMATIFALTIAVLTDASHFRNRSSDILFIEAIALVIGAWASYLKSRGLSFLVMHPFRRKNLAESWIDRVPEKFVGSAQEMDAEARSLQIQRSREFRRDLAIASGILLATGLIVQYI
ncbi:MAG TPA: hypothetical protein DDW14_06140 [Spirochaetaceae bacterium]|jgi:hypothetical protein|nr:hypothetical protein [Spirochaetaceae bacterium]